MPKCINQFGVYEGSEINHFRPGHKLSFDTTVETYDDGTGDIPEPEPETDYEPFYEPSFDDDGPVNGSDETQSQLQAQSEEVDEHQLSSFDYLKTSYGGGSLDKTLKIRRIARSGITSANDEVRLSKLPPKWQARGRGICQHLTTSDEKALLARILSVRRTNHRKARQSIKFQELEPEPEYEL